MARETRDDLQFSRARWARRAESAQKRADYFYNRLRALEDAVRTAATEDTLPTRNILTDLARRVPKHPRPTLTELRKKNKR